MTNAYVTVNCIESCPHCKNKIEMEYWDVDATHECDLYRLDCKYFKNIILSPWTKCNGMFEPKEKEK